MSFFQKVLGTEKGINYTNMGLMVLSALLAFLLPFKLFLFVYAVLGPLHYLTEISWLEKRKYFIGNKWHIWPFGIAALLMTISLFDPRSPVRHYSTTLMATVVVYTLLTFFWGKHIRSLLFAGLAATVCIILKADRMLPLIIAFSIFLPTICHVFIFTGIFLLSGAFKTKSTSGFISFFIFLICAFSFAFYFPPNREMLSLAEKNYIQQFFLALNQSLAHIFGIVLSGDKEEVFNIPSLIAVQRFIAFAYTYHYLNWFSKTTIIRWHDVSRSRFGLILLLWVLSVLCYYVDYRLGFMVLFFLSMLHVFLEFPLNIISFINIGSSIRMIFASKK